MREEKAQNRLNWLKAIGFVRDPFLPESFHAENDQFLSDYYVEKKGIADYLVGRIGEPGYRIIASNSGGGKTGIKETVRWEYERKVGAPKILILDYSEHNYPVAENMVFHHVSRIFNLAEKALNKKITKKRLLIEKTPRAAMKSLVDVCVKLGFSGVYLLIDNVDADRFEQLSSLILFESRRLIVKYFIGEHLLMMAHSINVLKDLPKYFVKWSEDECNKILNQRLAWCLAPKLATGTLAPGLSFLCQDHIAKDIQKYFIKIGRLGGPALMLRFGDLLLREHTKVARKGVDLIGYETLEIAQLQLFNDLLNSNSYVREDIEDNFYNKTIRTSAKPRANIFLLCNDDDRDLVRSKIYQALLTENYKPWLDSEDLVGGQERKIEIESAIDKADFIIPCFSVQAIEREGDFQKYLKYIIDKSKEIPSRDIFIIPFRLEECELPKGIDHLHHIDIFAFNYLEGLFSALKKGMKSLKLRKE